MVLLFTVLFYCRALSTMRQDRAERDRAQRKWASLRSSVRGHPNNIPVGGVLHRQASTGSSASRSTMRYNTTLRGDETDVESCAPATEWGNDSPPATPLTGTFSAASFSPDESERLYISTQDRDLLRTGAASAVASPVKAVPQARDTAGYLTMTPSRRCAPQAPAPAAATAPPPLPPRAQPMRPELPQPTPMPAPPPYPDGQKDASKRSTKKKNTPPPVPAVASPPAVVAAAVPAAVPAPAAAFAPPPPPPPMPPANFAAPPPTPAAPAPPPMPPQSPPPAPTSSFAAALNGVKLQPRSTGPQPLQATEPAPPQDEFSSELSQRLQRPRQLDWLNQLP